METAFCLTGTKEERYKAFLPLFKSLLSHDDEPMSILANSAAAIKEAFGFFWVGFYLVKGDRLFLGPFQGSTACTWIRKGKGVCGTAWEQKKTQVVEDVEKIPYHIACSSLSRSEIVVPLMSRDEVIGVLDIDSTEIGTFDETDQKYLEEVAHHIMHYINAHYA